MSLHTINMTQPQKRPLKTYSRIQKRKLEDEETPIQKSNRRRITREHERGDGRRVEDTWKDQEVGGKLVERQRGDDVQDFSSSSDPIRFSDDARDATTPPSSPPPVLPPLESTDGLGVNLETPPGPLRRALKSINGNAQITSFFKPPAPRKETINEASNPPKQVLVQSQINLGLNNQKTCKTCGMTYVPSNAEDSAVHTRYHDQNVKGVEVNKRFRQYYENSAIWRGGNNDIVVCAEMHENSWHRKRVGSILEIVTRDLGAVVIPELDLAMGKICLPRKWDDEPVDLPTMLLRKTETGQDDLDRYQTHRRYEAYLYLSGTKCVGLCLTERISRAYEVLPGDHDRDHSAATSDIPIIVRERPSPATVGILRIWTSTSYRGNGVAVAMLNSVRSNYRGIGEVPKDKIAFSQPTTSGARLARKWFGKQHGWLVYKD